ncbi:hypothetical protein BJ742DRAFT_794808 [Cladochytrium replicatum]|nr:hypothetical protein BJ742DRAFT_794808 [Cladochytrium replicatum]
MDIGNHRESLHDNLLSRVWRFFAKPKATRSRTKKVWQLRVWDPQQWSANLFSVFSPIQLAILYSADVRGFRYAFGASACATFIVRRHFCVHLFSLVVLTRVWFVKMYLLVKYESDLLADSKILSGQLLHEYTSFVHTLPPYRLRREVGTEIDDDFGQQDAGTDVCIGDEEKDELDLSSAGADEMNDYMRKADETLAQDLAPFATPRFAS